MLELRATSVSDTYAIAAALAALAVAGDIIALSGEMGAGKTAFAQGFGRAVGVTEPITSPTYTLVHSYDIGSGSDSLMLHHADLYRLDRTAEVADLGLLELAEFGGIVLVEWGDVVEAMFGDHLSVHLEPETSALAPSSGDENVRLIRFSASGSRWAARWGRVSAACEEFRC